MTQMVHLLSVSVLRKSRAKMPVFAPANAGATNHNPIRRPDESEPESVQPPRPPATCQFPKESRGTRTMYLTDRNPSRSLGTRRTG